MKAEWTNSDSLTTMQTTKAILVIDIPRNCFDCPLIVENKDGIWCGAIRYEKEYHMRSHHYCGDEGRPSWCPLKPMPHKLQADWYTDGYKEGYNACLDEILGETE